MASFPPSLRTTLVQSSSEIDPTELVVDTTTIPRTQPSSDYIQLNVTLTKVPNTSSIKKQGPPSSSLTKKQQGISISTISTFVAISSFSIIVSIRHVSIASTMIVENLSQLRTKVHDKGKKIVSTILNEKGKEVEAIDMDEDIVIPN